MTAVVHIKPKLRLHTLREVVKGRQITLQELKSESYFFYGQKVGLLFTNN